MVARQILIRPVVTEKATQTTESSSITKQRPTSKGQEKSAGGAARGGPTYTFEVSVEANKHQIREAVQAHFTVSVARVRTLVLPGKARRRGSRVYRRPARKKAMVQLKAGHTIDLFAQEG